MADRQTTFSAKRMMLVIVLALAVLAAIAWQMGLFAGRGTDEGLRTSYEAGVTDKSGGELIVTDPAAPQVEDIRLPETPMTPVPANEEQRPAEGTEAE